MTIKNFVNKSLIYVRGIITYPLARLYCLLNHKLDTNKYYCISMSGTSYGDNIKCISDYIATHNQNAKIVWAFTANSSNYQNCPHKSVSLYSFEYYREMLTSKYIISNARLNRRMFHKQQGQIYLQTWHGTALKRIGKEAGGTESLFHKLTNPSIFEFDVNHTDIMISGSQFMTEIYRRSFEFKGDMWEVGTPRNDIFFQHRPDLIKKVHNHFGVPKDVQIILYAPTFRSDGSFKYYNIDADTLKKTWKEINQKECVFMARLHPALIDREEELKKILPSDTIFASSYPDMQELLYATDLLITDYSSSIFDIMYAYTPVLLYTPDANEYDRGFYFKLNELPFLHVNNNSEIENTLHNFSQEEYQKNIDAFLVKIGSHEKGEASALIYERLKSLSL